ncbi:MAG: succinyl-CoA--3-ketoacid-CoA transferase, partial [Oscillospiraceae bacterium]|nr:succinyl-CoA--3-ketoacid-CoA transferase [Oscillospiraceae bacterium]
GNPKILKKCALPLTAAGEVDYIISELCVLHRTEKGLVLEELAPGVSVEDVVSKTGAELIIPDKIGSMV